MPCEEARFKYYQKMSLYSMIVADFEARNQPIFDPDKDQCKTIDVCEQIPCCNGFSVINKLNDLTVQGGYYKSPFGQNNNEWLLSKT